MNSELFKTEKTVMHGQKYELVLKEKRGHPFEASLIFEYLHLQIFIRYAAPGAGEPLITSGIADLVFYFKEIFSQSMK
jgi:hypothetical protein